MSRKDDRLSFVSYPKLTEALKKKAHEEEGRKGIGRVTLSDVIRAACEREVGLA